MCGHRVCWFSGLCTVRTGLRVPDLGQCVPGTQTRHQDDEEGPAAGHVGREDQRTHQEGHIP